MKPEDIPDAIVEQAAFASLDTPEIREHLELLGGIEVASLNPRNTDAMRRALAAVWDDIAEASR
jgi:hypothetical protein